MKLLVLLAAIAVGLVALDAEPDYSRVENLAALLVSILGSIVTIIKILTEDKASAFVRGVLWIILIIFLMIGAPACFALNGELGKIAGTEPPAATVVPATVAIAATPTALVEPPATPAALPPPTPAPECDNTPGILPCWHTVKSGETLASIARLRYSNTAVSLKAQFDAICLENYIFLQEQFFRKTHPNERKRNWDDDPCNFILPGNRLKIPFLQEQELQGVSSFNAK